MSEESFEGCSARAEARGLLRLIGRDGNTVEAIRELIAVPARTERALRAYAQAYPEEAPSVERNLRFRQAVGREFERLVREGVPVAELRAMDIRIRASQRAGELIAQMPKAKGGQPYQKSSTGRQERPVDTLEELGISKDQSSQWQQLAGIAPEELEEELPVRAGKRTSVKKVKESERETVGRAFSNAQP
jgi:hypothetical protein